MAMLLFGGKHYPKEHHYVWWYILLEIGTTFLQLPVAIPLKVVDFYGSISPRTSAPFCIRRHSLHKKVCIVRYFMPLLKTAEAASPSKYYSFCMLTLCGSKDGGISTGQHGNSSFLLCDTDTWQRRMSLFIRGSLCICCFWWTAAEIPGVVGMSAMSFRPPPHSPIWLLFV